ncbi:MAG TPA: dicarboxylate--CoA ligase PimA [Stellaceae bacterium]|nr:dicarboxylate--CoA ligase PimA [Stellaceae bacterium]
MTAAAPRPWEKSYPPGLRWDAPIATATLGRLVDDAARLGTCAAIEFRGHNISYAELGHMVDRTAAALLRRGIGPGARVALYLPNTPYYPVAFFAAAKAGATIVPLSPLDAERTLAMKLDDSGARTLVAINAGTFALMARKLLERGLVDRVILGDEMRFGAAALAPEEDGRITPFSALLNDDAPPPPFPQVSEDDVALVQYTGGTTGTPKGALLTHGNLTAAVSIYDAWGSKTVSYRPGEERVICVLPLFHIYGLTSVLLRHLAAGNLILLRERFDAETTVRDIEEKRATILSGVPTMWIALTALTGIERRDLSSLRVPSCGAAPLPPEVAQRIERLFGKRLTGGWGMTETSPAGTGIPPGCDRVATIGLPLPGVVLEVVALDDPHRVLPPGETGELRIKGPNVTKGYWNRPQETAAAFADGFLLTGDIGRMDADGFFYLLDRKKDMIISGGFNVYPRVIEDAIYEHPAVEEAAVIGVADRYRGEAAKVFVKLRPGTRAFTLEELREFLADRLGRHELPAALEFRDSLPKTAVGKVSRRELVEEERRSAATAEAAQ